MPTQRLLFAASALTAAILLPLPGGLDVFDTSIFLVEEGVSRAEDAYVLSQNAIVSGVIDGDLVIAATTVRIDGTINGDVLVASDGRVTIGGSVAGALRGFAREVLVEAGGSVADDVSVGALTTTIDGDVGRDVIVFGGRLRLNGTIGRDLLGRFVVGEIDGVIVGDADFSTSRLDIGPNTRIGGDILYRSNRQADLNTAAVVGGTLTRLSPQPSFFVDVWWTLAKILGFLAFVFTGIILLWLMPRTSRGAVTSILTRPWRALALGAGALVAVPVVLWLFVRSFVGIPIALLLGVLYLLGFFFGPIPAVAAVGTRIMRGRGGVYGGFVVGAVVWRIGIEVLRLVAGGLYVAALIWGIGGWVGAVWGSRGVTNSAVERALPLSGP
jgi:hypothetical protein